MLLTDLIVDGIDIDWSAHLPHMLHVIFLGKPKMVVGWGCASERVFNCAFYKHLKKK